MAKKKSGRNRKRYWNDVRALEQRFGCSHAVARQLWRKTVNDIGGGKRSRISREAFTNKAKRTKKKSEVGEKYHGRCDFQTLDGPMTVAMRRGFEMRFEFGPWWSRNTTTPKDESEAMDLRREMRDAGDDFYAHWGAVKSSSDSWRIQGFIKVFVNEHQCYFRFEWDREKK